MVACAAFVHHSISMDENVGGKIVHQSKKIMWIQLLYHVSRGILDVIYGMLPIYHQQAAICFL